MIYSANPNGPYGAADGVQVLSLATCKLSLFRNETKLSTASGFITEDEKSWLLVTALHNFTGRDFFSGSCISPKLATPNNFRATITVKREGDTIQKFDLKGNLFSNGAPIFLYDWSDEGGDIAVIKMPKGGNTPTLVTINGVASQSWTVFAGLDVFALGYPSALDVNGTPIWKKVSIASEPSQRVNGKNATLTDGLTFSGMSGGPVLINQSQGFNDDKAYVIGKELAVRVIGVYGGRFDTDTEKSGTLGFYWPMEIVEAIVAEERQVGSIDCE